MSSFVQPYYDVQNLTLFAWSADCGSAKLCYNCKVGCDPGPQGSTAMEMLIRLFPLHPPDRQRANRSPATCRPTAPALLAMMPSSATAAEASVTLRESPSLATRRTKLNCAFGSVQGRLSRHSERWRRRSSCRRNQGTRWFPRWPRRTRWFLGTQRLEELLRECHWTLPVRDREH